MQVLTFATPLLKSNMYLVEEGGRGVILDPFFSQEFARSILRACEAVDYIILTHEHYDHISGLDALRERFRCPVLCSEACGRRIGDPGYNLSRYQDAYLTLQTGETVPEELLPIQEYAAHADDTFVGQRTLRWQGHELLLTETPGHSPGSVCVLLAGKTLFVGDSLMRDNSMVTRLPGRDKRSYQQITLPYLAALPPDVLVYPGHYSAFRLGEHPEWKRYRKKKEEEGNDKSGEV